MSSEKSQVRAYLLSDGRVIREGELAKYVVAKEAEKDKSTQPDPKSWYSHKGLVEPPYGPSQLLAYLELNTLHARCCEQIATDVTGLGWSLVPVGGDPDTANREQKERALRFLRQPNTDQTHTIETVLHAAIMDRESIGWLALEVARRNKGPEGLLQVWHVPAHTIRRHKDKWRFRQAWEGDPRNVAWYKAYGRPENVNRKTGEPGKSKENAGNELIFLRRYTSKTSYYGLPPIIPAVGSIIGMGESRDYNISFFHNHAIPEYMLICEGVEGTLADEQAKKIELVLKAQHKGATNEHKTLLLTLPKGVTVTIERLSMQVRDASFRLYRESAMEEILLAHGVPRYRVGIGKVGALGGTDNRDANEVYKWSIARPRRLEIAAVVNMLLRDALAVTDWEFRFSEMDTTDREAERKFCETLFDRGAMNPNQLIEKFGLGEPYPEGNMFYVQGVPVGQVEGASVKARPAGLVSVLRQLHGGLREELRRREDGN